jgi:hypothetical protein
MLQIPLIARQPQQKIKRPYHGYKFHRMLIPYYELELANRHPRAIPAETMNIVLNDPNEFIRRLTRRLDSLEYDSSITELEFDFGDEPSKIKEE